MSMRINTLVTYFRPEEAATLIEFLDQLREVLIGTYGDEVTAMLHEASQPALHQRELWEEDEEQF